jgi:23S rRNA (adenine-N6)-dimethyltransferase
MARRTLSQNLLQSDWVAAQLVGGAEIGPEDHVLDIGAGSGNLTQAIAARAEHVTAVEIDRALAERLRERFVGYPTVQVVEGDVLSMRLSDRPFKVVSNLPFHLSTTIFHKLLDDPTVPLARAELIVELGFAVGLSSVHPSRLTSLSWQPWFEFLLTRRLSARLFKPSPESRVGVLSVRRRVQPLLDPSDCLRFRKFLRLGFRDSHHLRLTLRPSLSREQWKRLSAEVGVEYDALATDLDIWQWIALFQFADAADQAVDGLLGPSRGRSEKTWFRST